MSNSILLRNGTLLVHSADENDPHVTPQYNTDLLIKGDTIIEIGKDISTDAQNVQEVDCNGKIVCPGFISTHSHLWQTQLKGRHVDDTLLDYFGNGNLLSHLYEPEDTYWGQLTGCIEAINAGTTTALDHAHGCKTVDHTNAAIQATLDSGLRCLWAYSEPMRVDAWNENQCTPSQHVWTDAKIDEVAELTKQHNNSDSTSRLSFGLAFDYWFLPPERLGAIIKPLISAGTRTLTTHAGRNRIQGLGDPLTFLQKQAPFLFNSSEDTKMHNLVLSHATNVPSAEFESILANSKTINTSVSTTPESESQMGMHRSVAFYPSKTLAVPAHKVSLGIDCHTAASSFMPHAARVGLFNARILTNERLAVDGDKYPWKMTGNSGTELFNSFTVNGAKSLGLDHDDGGIGRLRVGRKADIVVFDTVDSVNMGVSVNNNPVTAITRFSEINDVDVVIIDGAIKKRDKRLLPFEVSDIGNVGSSRATTMSWVDIRKRLGESYDRLHSRISKVSIEKAKEMVIKLYHVDTSGFVDGP